MPEILTESFCERCGTRYTFESAAPRPSSRAQGDVARLPQFRLSDDTSMDEAMAAARNETDREQTSQQLDAFHKTFNFCMSCRQYTCGNCWNEAEGRCLSCAPELGQEVIPSPFGTVATAGALNLTDPEPNGVQDRNVYDLASAPAEPLAWPTSDLMREAEAEPVDGAFDAAIAAAAEDAANGADLAAAAESAPFDDETLPEDESFDFAARFAAVTAATEAVAAEPPATEARPPRLRSLRSSRSSWSRSSSSRSSSSRPSSPRRPTSLMWPRPPRPWRPTDVIDHPAAGRRCGRCGEHDRPLPALPPWPEPRRRDRGRSNANRQPRPPRRRLLPLRPRRRSPSLSRWRQRP
jgi:hypothetical protein